MARDLETGPFILPLAPERLP